VRVAAVDAECELVGVAFADDHRAGLAEARHRDRVGVGSRDQPLDPAVVGMPATWMTSLTQIGMPASGPALPSSSAASARRAAASAPSRSTYR
jgi:hypothetical protein